MQKGWVIAALIVLYIIFLRPRVRKGEGFEEEEGVVLKDPTTVSLDETIATYTGLPLGSPDIADYKVAVKSFYDEVHVPTKKVPTLEEMSAWVEAQPKQPLVHSPSLLSILDFLFTDDASPLMGQDILGNPSSTTSEAVAVEGGVTPIDVSGNALPPGAEAAPRAAALPRVSGFGKGVWGPEFNGLGDNIVAVNGDTTSTRQYPTLFGPNPLLEKSRRNDEGGYIQPPRDLSMLPSSASMGSDANSQYLPHSRVPGDQDLIPDPYRVSQSYSTSTYSSSKTAPVPFLADFSAFFS